MDRMTRIGEAERESLSGSAQARAPTRFEYLGALAAMIFIAAVVNQDRVPGFASYVLGRV